MRHKKPPSKSHHVQANPYYPQAYAYGHGWMHPAARHGYRAGGQPRPTRDPGAGEKRCPKGTIWNGKTCEPLLSDGPLGGLPPTERRGTSRPYPGPGAHWLLAARAGGMGYGGGQWGYGPYQTGQATPLVRPSGSGDVLVRSGNPPPARRSSGSQQVAYGVYSPTGGETFHRDARAASRKASEVSGKHGGVKVKVQEYRGDGRGGWHKGVTVHVKQDPGAWSSQKMKAKRDVRRARGANPGCSSCMGKMKYMAKVG